MDSPTLLPRLTIITVCLNAGKTLLRTLNSIASQTYPNIEVILCDGGSIDDTEGIFRQWLEMSESKLARIQWVRQQSVGMYAAMNEAFNFGSGEVITFLHADDAFAHKRVCELAMNSLGIYNTVHAVFGDVKVVASQWWNRRYIASKWWHPYWLTWGFMSPQPGCFIRTEAFRAVGPFLDTMQIGADFEWLLRFHVKQQFRSKWIDGIQVEMLFQGISMRGKESRKTITREIQQALLRQGLTVNRWKLWMRFPLKGFGIIRALWR